MREEIIKQLGIVSFTAEERFQSRRNEVYKMRARTQSGGELYFVYKKYTCGDVGTEYAALNALKYLRVPVVLDKGEDSLDLTYIEGPTMLSVLEESEAGGTPSEPFTEEFICFLESFYTALPGQVYGDINFRNFIFSNGKLFGVDFEEVRAGEKEEDIGRAAAFLLTYAPAFTEYKKEAAAGLIRYAAGRLRLDSSCILQAAEKELLNMGQRRGKSIPGDVFYAEFVKKYQL